MTEPTRSGMVALVGRPNVGKSTLINALVDDKISIVTPKPQTTRHRIVGVLTSQTVQIALIDTPGLHSGQKSALNRVMNETAGASLAGVDLALFVVEAGRWQRDDDNALARIAGAGVPVGLVINKVDEVADKNTLLPFMERCARRHEFEFMVPISAYKRDNLAALHEQITAFMPVGPFLYEPDDITDRPVRFLAAEIVREKLTLYLQQELPYRIAVEIESFDASDPAQLQIHACIWVARDNQKSIVIGAGGQMLKKVGRSARLSLVERLETAVDLRLWVKVDRDWPDREASVRALGH